MLGLRSSSACVAGVGLVSILAGVLEVDPAFAAPAERRAGAATSAPGHSASAPRPTRRARAPVSRNQPAGAPSRASASHGQSAAPPPAQGSALEAKGDPEAARVLESAVEGGVQTYTFGAQEVEGRLRSPQLLYFLRRVRAEFDPAPLGHRSFLLELSDTRRHWSLD